MSTLTGKPAAAKSEILPDNYRFLQDYIYRESGIVIDRDKHYLLEARLAPVAKKQQATDINDLCNLLRGASGVELRRQVVEAMTTHETLFFRDPHQYESLRKHAIPMLLEMRKSTRRLSIWSAAASSGQEAYSVAMMLLDMGLSNWTISVVATDLSEQILARARQGRYSQLEVNRGLPITCLVKYFTRQGLDWQLNDEVRRMVTFRQFDLRTNPRVLGTFDIVLCRNVLIYFDLDTKKKIVDSIRSTLQPGGFFVLGAAESAMSVTDKFERIQAEGGVLYRLD